MIKWQLVAGDPRQIFRPNLGRKIPLGLAITVFILTVIGAAIQPGGTFFAYVWRVTMPAVSAIVILVLLLIARPRLEISANGLLVVNILRQYRLEWSQVLAVRFARDAPWASLDLTDGMRLNLMAIQNSDGLRARAMALEIANRSNR